MRMFKKGFTLAEVLITLGVIGVIASVTLPALKADLDRNIWSQSLKANLSIMKSAMEQMKAKEDVDDLRDTVLWSDVVSKEVNASSSDEVIDSVKEQMDKYFKIEKISLGMPTDVSIHTLRLASDSTMDNYIRFYLANSSAINLVFYPASYTANCKKDFCNPVADLFLDVNADKGPNVYGKDIYRFYIAENGNIYPYGSEAVADYDESAVLWNSENGCAGKSPSGDGIACAARVIEDDYSINYQ